MEYIFYIIAGLMIVVPTILLIIYPDNTKFYKSITVGDIKEYLLFKNYLLSVRVVIINGIDCMIDKEDKEYFWVTYKSKKIKLKLNVINYKKLINDKIYKGSENG